MTKICRSTDKSSKKHTVETQKEKEAWSEMLKVRGKEVKFKLDTGAECNVL